MTRMTGLTEKSLQMIMGSQFQLYRVFANCTMICSYGKLIFFWLSSLASVVYSHGYVKSPRSRNFVAVQDGMAWGETKNDPLVEYTEGGPLRRVAWWMAETMTLC